MAEEETKVKVKVVAIDTASLFHFHIFVKVKMSYPFTINTGDKSVRRRSCSVVAHHEGLSSLRPGFKSRHEHPIHYLCIAEYRI